MYTKLSLWKIRNNAKNVPLTWHTFRFYYSLLNKFSLCFACYSCLSVDCPIEFTWHNTIHFIRFLCLQLYHVSMSSNFQTANFNWIIYRKSSVEQKLSFASFSATGIDKSQAIDIATCMQCTNVQLCIRFHWSTTNQTWMSQMSQFIIERMDLESVNRWMPKWVCMCLSNVKW